MVRHLFLDLEDTVIAPVVDGWFNTHMINVAKVKAFIEHYKPDYVSIFSFAIWDDAQKERFKQGTLPMLEASLGITISLIPTVDGEIIPVCTKMMNLGNGSVDFATMSEFWGKQEAFRLNMRHLFKSRSTPVEVALLDDVVYNELFEWPDLQVKGRIVNIDTWRGPDGCTQFEDPTTVGTRDGVRRAAGW